VNKWSPKPPYLAAASSNELGDQQVVTSSFQLQGLWNRNLFYPSSTWFIQSTFMGLRPISLERLALYWTPEACLRGRVSDYPSTGRMIRSQKQLTVHKPSVETRHACTIDFGWNQWLRSSLEMGWGTQKPSLLFTYCCTWRVREQNTYRTQRERREKKKEKQIYPNLVPLNQSCKAQSNMFG